MRKQHGFTLIELMIVVAILAILMAIAIPAYQDYTIRAQVSEGMNLAGGARTAVAEYWTDRGVWPTNNTEAGLEKAGSITGQYVKSVTVGADGKIQALFSKAGDFNAHTKLDTKILELVPTSSGGSVEWDCLTTTTGTDIEPRYLPARCRP
ncbi:MAG: pilin [Wenzhouxiangella sp.]|nr:pilin [Wenzhouxiangella sp.]MCH8478568.1 pilin [Wenzhouxiangella sp.]